jgi:hypothetical protein
VIPKICKPFIRAEECRKSHCATLAQWHVPFGGAGMHVLEGESTAALEFGLEMKNKRRQNLPFLKIPAKFIQSTSL